MVEPLGLYLHIPFCVQKCGYCDFLSAPATEAIREQYVQTVIREIEEKKGIYGDWPVDTIFVGGGTPTILESGQMERIMDSFFSGFSVEPAAEITWEMNPGTVSLEKLQVLKQYGVNRLSIGLQSTHNAELKILGRIHTYEAFLQTWDMVRNQGFSNVNIDLMSGLPLQTLQSYEETLHRICRLSPEHISAYSLIVEEGTPFESLYGEAGKQKSQLPEEETEREMYDLTGKLLSQAGFHQYEISNYAKIGRECKHNTRYWKRKPYLGLGLGAASFLEKTRFSNETDLSSYLENGKQGMFSKQEETKLSVGEEIEETMFLGLRMREGISIKEFEIKFGYNIMGVYGDVIEKWIERKRLQIDRKSGRISLTESGIGISNQIFVDFLEPGLPDKV